MGWQHKDEWKHVGNSYAVVVSRHTTETDHRLEGPHRWAVYAYIYPAHPHFAKFNGPDFHQPATDCMPGHSYVSYLRTHRNDNGDACSIQVGWDYNHLHDTEFTHCADKGSASAVFRDAEELVQWLEERQA